ncbi:hypothetical protein PCANC_09726 [Puccinia coronata f. sp. avenae]|uniref:Uncharacterized protein n=1 Tax=Puccinia coronata f. sp. avenae TaxID=200324 RepID=A0A2N5V7T3_9BASI|nr:hypothetical protein PCANC_09726 [Puccinia coronata f. sp. avenae]
MNPSHNRRNSFPGTNMGGLHIPPFNNTQYRNKEDKSDTSSGLPSMEGLGGNQQSPSIQGLGSNKPPPSLATHPREETSSHATTHFLEKEPEILTYQGGKIKSVKIKPMDKTLFFDGTNMTIKTFIRRYEDAADTDGASERYLAKQIVPFIIGADLKEEVEEMSGYEDRNWELLKKQLLNWFGSSLALVKYTREDLKNLIKTYTDKGGINTLEDFKMFRSKFENITHYLGRMGYVTNLEDFRQNTLEVLSSYLEITVTRELIRDNKMLASKDGGDILPDTATLFTYIHREVQTASVMERRNKIKRGEVKSVNPTQPTKPTPIPEKAIEELTKTLASWNVQKKPTTFFQSSHVPYAPAQFTSYKGGSIAGLPVS